MPPPLRRSALSLAVVATAAALALSGCSSDPKTASNGGSSGSSSSTVAAQSSPTASSTVPVPDGVTLTDQGSGLSFGDTATVIFEPTQGRGTVLQLTVAGVRKGSLDDFKGFILDDTYKQKAAYYYAAVRVKNVGKGNVGGVPIPLWGVNAANTLLPAVNFTTSFTKCPSKVLPASFGPGAVLNTCLVYLSPDQGALKAVSYRPSQAFNPITWTGEITTPAPKPTKKAKPKKR